MRATTNILKSIPLPSHRVTLTNADRDAIRRKYYRHEARTAAKLSAFWSGQIHAFAEGTAEWRNAVNQFGLAECRLVQTMNLSLAF